MKGLLIKDLYAISNFKRQYGLILLFMSAWCLFTRSFSFLAMYCILMSGMLVLSVISLDEAVHFDRYALTMPISVETLIKEKYVLTCICIGVGTLLAALIEGGAMLIAWHEGVEEWIVIATISTFFLLAYTISLPIVFKYGVEKARYSYIVVMLVMAGVILGGVYLTKNTPVMILDSVPTVLSCLIFVGILLIVDVVVVSVSYRISVRVVRGKEW